MLTAINNDLIKSSIVNPLSCNDDGLKINLDTKFPLLWKKNCACYGKYGGMAYKLAYIKTQADLIQNAQKYVGEKVDEVSVKSKNRKSLNSSSVRIGEGESFRKAKSGSCSWTKATSFQQFQNDREQHEKNDSVSSAYSYGTSFDRGYDRTAKDGCGWDRQYASSRSRSDSNSEGYTSSQMSRRSKSGSATGDMPGDPFQMPSNNIIPTISLDQFLGFGFSAQGHITGSPDAASNPDCGGIDENGNVLPCNPLPNYGKGQHARYYLSYSVSFNLGGAGIQLNASITTSAGFEMKQTSVCSWGQTCIKGGREDKSQFATQSSSESQSTGQSEDTSTEVRDIKRTGETHKQSESKVDSLSSATMRSQNEKKTGSDNSAHAQSDSSGSGQSWSKRHSENNSEANYESSYVSQARYWHGISQNLSKLFDSVNKEMDVLLKQISASYSPQYGVLTLPQSGIPCAPRYNLAFKNQGDPCLRGCSYCGNQTCGGCGRI